MKETGQTKAYFCDDIPGGGIIVECQRCYKELEDKTKYDEELKCPHCGTTLYCTPGASW